MIDFLLVKCVASLYSVYISSPRFSSCSGDTEVHRLVPLSFSSCFLSFHSFQVGVPCVQVNETSRLKRVKLLR